MSPEAKKQNFVSDANFARFVSLLDVCLRQRINDTVCNTQIKNRDCKPHFSGVESDLITTFMIHNYVNRYFD